MKQRLLCIALGATMCLALPVQAQTPFFNIYGSVSGEEGSKVAEIPGGGALVGGRVDDAGGWSDVMLTRVDANGNILWCTRAGTQDDEHLTGIAVDPTGGFYALLTTVDPLTPASYVSTVVARLDTNGILLWSKRFYETGHLYGTAIVATPGGGFTFAGRFDSVSVNNASHLQVTSCNGAGNILWSNLYATNIFAVPTSHEMVHMTIASNGDYIISQTYGVFVVQQLIRINSSGGWIWGENTYETGNRVMDIACTQGGIITLAYDDGTHKATIHYCDILYGFGVWSRTLSLDSTGNSEVIACDYDAGKIAVIGNYEDQNLSSHHFITEFDTAGNLISSGEVSYPLADVQYMQNGDIMLTGTLQGPHFGPTDTASMYVSRGSTGSETVCNYIPLIMQADTTFHAANMFNCSSYAWGNVTNITLTVSTGTQMLHGCALAAMEDHAHQQPQIFPNPAGAAVNLVFEQSELRTITVFNTLGEVVTSSTSRAVQVTLDAAGWSAGVYIVRVAGESGMSAQTISIVH
jgi:hypothetical protein